MSLVIVLVGAIAVFRLPNRELPDVDPPVVAVTTIYLGAAPEVVETSVTQPLEDELIGIEGIRHITSLSREQVSSITIEFELGRNVEEAANDVRDRVARVRNTLPEEVEDPVVAKADSDASPIVWLSFSSARHSQIELTTIAETRIKDRLSKLPGVSNVIIAGERRYSMRVWIDNMKLTGYGLTVTDVHAALERGNVDLPSGRVADPRREFTVRTLGELQTADAYAKLVLAERDGQLVRLGDVARIEVGAEDDRSVVRFNREPAIALGVVKQSKANTVAVAQAVHAEMAQLSKELPPGATMDVAYDSGVFIERSVRDVTWTIFEAIVLVIIVIYLFLRRLRSTLVPAAAIPVSVVGTFAFLYFLDFSINTLTLMGLTLAIGLVVDDAIVVLENITRWVERGASPREAAIKGMREISFAVLATTVSVVAVFLPLAFLTDQTGRLFREFGVTVAAAVSISGFVALTLSPMLSARLLRPAEEERGFKRWLERGFSGLVSGYGRLLRPVLAHSGLCAVAGAAWFAVGIALLQWIPREFVPTADRGNILILTETAEGSTFSYTDRYQRDVEDIVLGVPEIAKGFSVVSLGMGAPGAVNEGAMFVTLTPWEERSRTQQDIVAALVPVLWPLPGMQAFPLNPPSLGQSFDSSPVSLVIQGPDVRQLWLYAEEVARRLQSVPGLVNVRSDLVLNKPQALVTIDRDRAADLNVSVREIASTLQILLGGRDLSTFKRGGETYKVIVQLEENSRTRPSELLGLYVRGKDGVITPLQSVVSVKESTAPRALPHFDRQRAATVSASLLPGVALGGALEEVRSVAEDVLEGAPGYRLAFSGESEDFFESGSALAFA